MIRVLTILQIVQEGPSTITFTTKIYGATKHKIARPAKNQIEEKTYFTGDTQLRITKCWRTELVLVGCGYRFAGGATELL